MYICKSSRRISRELNEVKDQNTNKNNIIQECKKNADNEQILKKESKMKKNDNSSELNKTNIAEINNLLTTSLISGTIIFPNYHLLSIFSLQLAKNPLNLVNKSHISYIYIAKNIGILLNDILKNKNQDLLTNFKSSFISTINRDYKKNLSDFVYSNEEIIINNPFINPPIKAQTVDDVINNSKNVNIFQTSPFNETGKKKEQLMMAPTLFGKQETGTSNDNTQPISFSFSQNFTYKRHFKNLRIR